MESKHTGTVREGILYGLAAYGWSWSTLRMISFGWIWCALAIYSIDLARALPRGQPPVAPPAQDV
ncbi:MAG: hypothetical protein L0Z62_20895 [Gemmataceae bacterium]|nr:hypothetical protein [Gemmataceae bacterium]